MCTYLAVVIPLHGASSHWVPARGLCFVDCPGAHADTVVMHLHFGTVEVSVPERTKAGGTHNPFWATIFPNFVLLICFQRNHAFFAFFCVFGSILKDSVELCSVCFSFCVLRANQA